MNVVDWVVVSAVPAIGFLILWIVLNRWGRKHDPMKHSNLDHFTPGAPGRDRSSFDD